MRFLDPGPELLLESRGHVGHVDEHLIVEPGAGAVQMEHVVTAAAGDVSRDRRRQVRGGDVVDLDRALVLFAELLREGREPAVVVGDEVLPLHDAERPLLLRGGFAQKDGGNGGCSGAGSDAFQDAPAAQLPLLSLVHEPSLRVAGAAL